MDMDLPPNDDPRRIAVRSWLAAHPTPTRAQLGQSGYLTPHWPAPWGLDAEPEHQLIIDDELEAVATVYPESAIGLGWAGPTILVGGTPE